jgi:hypothetical protein
MSHLNAFLTLLAVVLSLETAHSQGSKTLTGRILSEELEGLAMSSIYAQDDTVIGKTDMAGYFKIDVPISDNKIVFKGLGMEWATVNLSGECANLEVILLYRPTYCFMSPRRANRKRFKRFKHLPQLQQQAYEKGLFKSPAPCAFPIFTE